MKWIVSAALLCVSYLPVSAADKVNRQQIVCHIAFQYLDHDSKAKLESLTATALTQTSFVELCSKPLDLRGARADKLKYLQDDVEASIAAGESKTQLAIRATRNLPPVGYMDVPRDAVRIDGFDCPEADICLMKALAQDTETLMDSSEDPDTHLAMINNISWHMARLHFPLSFGFSDDLGGHWIRVGGYTQCARTLNDFWAKCAPQLAMEARGLDLENTHKYAALLYQEVAASEAKEWVSSSTLLTWANQSYRIATSNKMGYCVWEKEQCRYTDDQLAFDPDGQLYDQYSRKVFVGKIEGVKTQEFGVHSMTYKKLLLDEEYKNWAMEVTEKRLKQAGVRLAAFLAASL